MPEDERVTEIKEIIKTLETVWLQFPDWRLGQLIANSASYHKEEPFYMTDKQLMAELFAWRLQFS